MSGTMIGSPKKEQSEVLRLVNDQKLCAALVKVLPKGLTADRFQRQALTLCRRTPDLLKCDPVSVIGGIIQAAELGLELSGALGHCYLIPRNNSERHCKEAVFQLGYRGYKELATRSGRVTNFTPRIVKEKDDWKVRYGTDHKLEHTPSMEESPPVAYYCVAWVVGSHIPDFEVMSRKQVEAWKSRYVKATGARSPWSTHFDAMALKTVTGILARRMPLSVEQQEAFSREEVRPDEPLEFTPAAHDAFGAMGLEPTDAPVGPDHPAYAPDEGDAKEGP